MAAGAGRALARSVGDIGRGLAYFSHTLPLAGDSEDFSFPFGAIVGLELAKRSLIYHGIDPKLGGTLFMGHRGCAKKFCR